MAIRYYDEAIANKIKKWVKDPNMTILKPDESTRLFNVLADKGNDKPIKLPVIAISRDREITITEQTKQSKSFNGFKLDGTSEGTITLNAIPIEINYQIDIYTHRMEQADEYLRNFVFNFINYPKLEIEIPYNDVNYKHISNLYLDSTISDNSDIQEHLFADQFVRYTLKINVGDAYLFSAPVKENVKIISMGLDVKDRVTHEITESEEIIDLDE